MVVAALGYLEVGPAVAGGDDSVRLLAGRVYIAEELGLQPRLYGADGLDYRAEAPAAEHAVDLGELGEDLLAVALRQAARDDDLLEPSLFFKLGELEDVLYRLALGALDEGAGIDDDDIDVREVAGYLVARFVEQPEHLLAVDGVLRAAERYHAYLHASSSDISP